MYLENGMNIEVLKICRIEDLSSLLCSLNMGSRIIFKRKLEEFQKGSVWVEVISEVCYPIPLTYFSKFFAVI